jgi:hypothetical protein
MDRWLVLSRQRCAGRTTEGARLANIMGAVAVPVKREPVAAYELLVLLCGAIFLARTLGPWQQPIIPPAGARGRGEDIDHHNGRPAGTVWILRTIACYTAATRSDGKTPCVAEPCHRPSNAEVKLRGPDGVIIDISEYGWLGNAL